MAWTCSIPWLCLLLGGVEPLTPPTDSVHPGAPSSVILNPSTPEVEAVRSRRGARWFDRLLPRFSRADNARADAIPLGHVPLSARPQSPWHQTPPNTTEPIANGIEKSAPSPAPTIDKVPDGFVKLDQKKIATPVSKLSNEELLSWLHKPSWVRATDGKDQPLEPSSPWHQPFVSELVDRCIANAETRARIEPEFRLGLASRANAELRASSALGLVLLGRAEGLDELNRIALDGSAAVPKRVAAFYALATMPDKLGREGLGSLYDTWFPAPKGDSVGDARTRRSVAMVSVELVAGVLWAYVSASLESPDFDAAKDPLLARAIEFGDESSRRIAAIGFSKHSWRDIPLPLGLLLRDVDPLVRRTAVEALGAHATDAGKEKIIHATFDSDPRVRSSAIPLLARFSDGATSQRLEELSVSDHPIDRQAVARVAGQRAMDAMVHRLASDPSWTVRRSVAEALGTTKLASAQRLLERMLDDRSPEVQEAAVRAFALRPEEEAVDGLLIALGSTTLSTRRAAAERIVPLWPLADSFPVMENPVIREKEHKRLVELWDKERTMRPPTSAALPSKSNSGGVDAARIEDRLHRWYQPEGYKDRAGMARELVDIGPDLLPVLEDFHLRRQSFPSQDLLRHVCAPLDPAYALLADLYDAPRGSRSVAASRVRLAFKDRKMTETQAILVSEFIAITGDRTSWLELVPLLERDCAEESARLDGEGTRHSDPLIRQATCERIATRASAEHLVLLRPLFRDLHVSVRVAALEAASKIHDASVTADLQEAIVTREPEVRLAAAAGLHRHGVSAGTEELIRLARDPNPAIRRAVIAKVSEQASVDPQSAIRLFTQALEDDKLSVKQQAIAGLQSLLGKDFQRDKFGRSLPLEAQIAQWNHALQSASLSGSLPETLMRKTVLDE